MTFENTTVPRSFAGFWRRVLACIIDGLLLGLFQGVLAVPVILIGIVGTTNPPDNPEDVPFLAVLLSGMVLLLIIVSIVLDWLYHAVMESSAKQATLGKIAVGIQVTDLNGKRISFARATGRYFAKFLSAAVFFVGYLLAGTTQQKQALHDMVAGTLVVLPHPEQNS